MCLYLRSGLGRFDSAWRNVRPESSVVVLPAVTCWFSNHKTTSTSLLLLRWLCQGSHTVGHHHRTDRTLMYDDDLVVMRVRWWYVFKQTATTTPATMHCGSRCRLAVRKCIWRNLADGSASDKGMRVVCFDERLTSGIFWKIVINDAFWVVVKGLLVLQRNECCNRKPFNEEVKMAKGKSFESMHILMILMIL